MKEEEWEGDVEQSVETHVSLLPPADSIFVGLAGVSADSAGMEAWNDWSVLPAFPFFIVQ